MYETSKVSINGSVLTVKGLSESSFMHSHNIYSGGCLSPVVLRSGWHKPDFSNKSVVENFWTGKKTIAVPPTFGVDFRHVRCRHCPMCTAAARHDWAERTVREHEASKFSIFGTLTFSERWFARRWREENSYDVESTFIDVPDFEERNRQTELKWLLQEFTNWLKRLRSSGRKFRYFAVTEFGSEKGRPHIHFIMHLYRGASYRETRKALKANFEHFPGCTCGPGENCRVGWADIDQVRTEGACHYVCKYLSKQWENVDEHGVISSKSVRSRVRASQSYGHLQPKASLAMDFQSSPEGASRKEMMNKGGNTYFSPQRSEDDTAAQLRPGPDGLGGGVLPTFTGLDEHRDTGAGTPARPRERWSDARPRKIFSDPEGPPADTSRRSAVEVGCSEAASVFQPDGSFDPKDPNRAPLRRLRI